MTNFDLFEELVQELERLEQEQASLEERSYTAYRYAQWCQIRSAELENERYKIQQLISRYEQAAVLYCAQGGS